MSAPLLGHHRRTDLESETFIPTVTPTLPAYGGPRGTTNNQQFDDHALVVGALTGNKDRGGWRAGPDEAAAGHVIALQHVAADERRQNGSGVAVDGPMYTLDGISQHGVAHALRAEGADASEDGTGRGTPLVPVAVQESGVGVKEYPTAGTVRADAPGSQLGGTLARQGMSVRRLTPVECERLQGFPDGWTEGLSDSARYRCLGNAVAVPVVEWIGRQLVAHLERVA